MKLIITAVLMKWNRAKREKKNKITPKAQLKNVMIMFICNDCDDFIVCRQNTITIIINEMELQICEVSRNIK